MNPEPRPELLLDVQYASEIHDLPEVGQFQAWAQAALCGAGLAELELVIRIVDEGESRALNARYRARDASTNVLSFPFEPPPGVPLHHLGDLVICAPVVIREALAQHKTPDHHWAHMVVHGVLHLQGYDHIDAHEAQTMELLETRILGDFGIPDPYTLHDTAVETGKA